MPGPAMHKPYPFLSQEDPCARQVGGVLTHLDPLLLTLHCTTHESLTALLVGSVGSV